MYYKKAEMSIFGALIAFAIIILICPVFEFYQVSQKTDITEKNIKAALMDTCVSDAILRYNDIKYLNTETYIIDYDNYESAIFESLGYENKGPHSWKRGDITISNVSLVYNKNSRSMILKYKLSVPFKVLNKTFKVTTVDKKDIVAFEDIISKAS